MTPAEAREIDRQEFEAERAAIRQRAYELLRKAPLPAKPLTAAPQEPSPASRAPLGPTAQLHTHNGLTMTLAEWAKHLGLHHRTLAYRLRQKWPIERVLTSQKLRGRCQSSPIIKHDGKAMTVAEWAKYLGLKHNTLHVRLMRGVPVSLALSPRRLARQDQVKRRPGVVDDLSGSEGTGAGSSAQETPEIDFHEKTNSR